MKKTTFGCNIVAILCVGLLASVGPVPSPALGQSSSSFRSILSKPFQTGDAPKILSTGDLEAIHRALADSKPWIIYGDTSGPIGYLPPAKPPLLAYLEPDRITPTLIRGRLCGLMYDLVHWIANCAGLYAQVSLDGVPFESIDWIRTEYRPFGVSGQFADDEILSIARFIRDMQRGPPLQRAVSGATSEDPIRSLRRISDDTVQVSLGGVDWAAQIWTLKREGERWVVTRSVNVVA